MSTPSSSIPEKKDTKGKSSIYTLAAKILINAYMPKSNVANVHYPSARIPYLAQRSILLLDRNVEIIAAWLEFASDDVVDYESCLAVHGRRLEVLLAAMPSKERQKQVEAAIQALSETAGFQKLEDLLEEGKVAPDMPLSEGDDVILKHILMETFGWTWTRPCSSKRPRTR
jgi:hypothetical protein